MSGAVAAGPLAGLVLHVDATSACGPVRARNEDIALVGEVMVRDGAARRVVAPEALAQPLLLAVADGLGGHRGGAVASAHVASRMREAMAALTPRADAATLQAGMLAALQAAHVELQDLGARDHELRGLATTWTGIAVTSAAALLVHVGDSRCYRWRDGVLSQQTRDHSLWTDDTSGGRRRSLLTSAVGVGDGVAADVVDLSKRMLPGDVYVLCTDGVMAPVDAWLAEAVAAGDSASLVERAIADGSTDNVTVVRVAVGSVG